MEKSRFINIEQTKRIWKSVKSKNPFLAGMQEYNSAIQTRYNIVKAHGGELIVESSNQGSGFTIKLPMK